MRSRHSADKTADKEGAGAVGETCKCFILYGERGRNRTYNLLIKSRNKRQHGISDLGQFPSVHQQVSQISTYSALPLFLPVFSPSMSKGCQSQKALLPQVTPKHPRLVLFFPIRTAYTEIEPPSSCRATSGGIPPRWRPSLGNRREESEWPTHNSGMTWKPGFGR